MIKEEDGGYVVYTRTGRRMSRVHTNYFDAEKRLKQVEEYGRNRIKERMLRQHGSDK